AGFLSLFGDNPQTVVYFAIEFGAIGLGITTCLLMLRRDPGLALYGLLAIGVSLTGGIAQGMHRYILSVPSVFLVLGQWGESAVFDRAWTLASVLLMALLATLFTFDMWVG
ncbi:MAG: hypothetical protein F6K28_55955, partial [Microcoleus sp. SIO2G3]|nr:hypothetical protein [Microcoleus sp. SIO2G3]